MKKIPYGISDFKRLKTEDFYFIDKTDYIEKIENHGSYLMFLRPRRFGKSLLIAILEAYYDSYFKDDFNAIFKETYILNNKTKEASSYMVLRFDFSAIDIYNVEDSFRSYLLRHINAFIDRYGLDIEPIDSPIDLLDAIFVYMKKNGLNFYLLITLPINFY